MKKLMKKWQAANNKPGVIILQHRLFGRQKISVDQLQTFCDERIGIRIKGGEIFMYLSEVESYSDDKGELMIDSGMKKITIIANFL